VAYSRVTFTFIFTFASSKDTEDTEAVKFKVITTTNTKIIKASYDGFLIFSLFIPAVLTKYIQAWNSRKTRTYNCIDLKMTQWMGRNMLSIQWFNEISQFGYSTAVFYDCSIPVYIYGFLNFPMPHFCQQLFSWLNLYSHNHIPYLPVNVVLFRPVFLSLDPLCYRS